MGLAEMPVVQLQYQLKLVVVQGAELTESLLNLLHHVHVLRRLSIHSHITIIDGCI